MIQVCLINPPLDKKTTSKFPMSGVPLGIAYLAAYLREKKIEVKAIDAPILGIDYRKTAELAVESGAKIIGISCLTENRYAALKTLEEIKRINSEIVTIIGGLHATFTDRLLLDNYSFIDIVVRGEGEETLYELVKNINNKKPIDKILGITFRKDGKIMSNPCRQFISNIERLPFPAYDLFPMDSYPLPPDVKDAKQTSLITTSRGCPMGCKFCETSMAWGRKVRSTSAERLYKEVEYLNKKFGIDYIRFADDLFTLKKEKVIKFCQLVIKNKLMIKFRIQARVDTVDEEMLDMLKKAGCDLIEYGAESGSDRILKIMGKNITTEKIKKAVELTRKAGIGLKYFLIVGSLEEKEEETWETFRLIKETKPDWIGINALTIYPGTEVYNVAKQKGLINDRLWIDYINPKTGNAPLYTEYYSKKEMIFLAQLGHVWSCKNSPKREEYPKFEKFIARFLSESLAKLLVKNKLVRKTAANAAWVLSPFLP
ncbi:B12-binding domain-containing radical SAM protein [Candidatus Pacearchaeota archaeon]|nr:B12-binding domain-containing radical SAM protein [Candidatus Pacearchaeota archaeon]